MEKVAQNLRRFGERFEVQIIVDEPEKPNPGALTGKIVDAATKKPIELVKVSASESQIAYSDQAGHFTLDGLSAGNYSLTITSQGYLSRTLDALVESDQTTDLGEILLQATTPQINEVSGGCSQTGVGSSVPCLLGMCGIILWLVFRPRFRKG